MNVINHQNPKANIKLSNELKVKVPFGLAWPKKEGESRNTIVTLFFSPNSSS